jgi:hypothetical protein
LGERWLLARLSAARAVICRSGPRAIRAGLKMTTQSTQSPQHSR